MKFRSRSRGIARLLPLGLGGARAGSAVFMVAALLLFSLSTLNPASLSGARARAADLFAPLLAAVNQPFYQAASYVRAASGIAQLQEENARLSQENARLREWYQAALSLQAENQTLQKLLNIKLEPQHSYVTAKVIADSGSAFARTLLVLAGSDDSVKAGQAVLSGDGLIGRVIETGRKTARVLLLSDINSRIPVMIEGSNQHAILAGNNDGLPALLHLPPEADLAQGARVVTSGHGGLFPYGLPVGLIVRQKEGRHAVKPYAAADQIYMVRIIDRAGDGNLIEARDGTLQ